MEQNRIKSKFIVSSEEYNKLNSEPKIVVDGRSISISLIKAILKDDLFFDYALNFFHGYYSDFVITTNALQYMKYSKHTLVKAMEQLFKTGELSEKQYFDKYMILKKIISIDAFKDKYLESIYYVVIDKQEYAVPVKEFIDFLNLDNDAYYTALKNSNSIVAGLPIECFIYALVSFFKENNIIANYEIEEKMKYRIANLSRSVEVDIQALNRLNQTEDTLYEKININPELREAVLSNMPEDLSLLEKAIYIYIKMCQILTYDDEYYVESRANLTRDHFDIDYVQNITPKNNKAVCFEFNIIYARFLSELGINFKSNYYNSYVENYGSAHVYLDFRIGKFLISADSAKTILQSDMTRAKTGLHLRRIECLNNNARTKQEFNDTLAKIYSMLLKERDNGQTEVTFDGLLSQYHQIHDSVTIPLEEKLDILLNKVNDASLLGIDALSYILTLKDVIFNGYETNNNIFYVVIRSKLNPVDMQNAMASAIFTINTLGIGEDRFANRYYYYTPGQPLRELSKEDLEYYFSQGIFAYIETGSPAVPGLSIGR